MPYTTSATAAMLRRRFTSSSSSSSSPTSTSTVTFTPSALTIGNCRQFIGPPLSREDVQAKLQKSGMFRQAVSEFSMISSSSSSSSSATTTTTTTIVEEETANNNNMTNTTHDKRQSTFGRKDDVEHAAVQFEYGMRLRNCLSAAAIAAAINSKPTSKMSNK
jgi:hypothetical protein